MTRTRFAPIVGLGLVALLAAAPAANAKPPRPDLVVKKVSKPPTKLNAGAKLKLVVKVSNKGKARAGKSQLAFYLAKGKKHGKKDKRLKRVKVKPLGKGKTAKKKVSLKIPATTLGGSYRLIACADDKHKVKESKESNDCRATRKLQVPPAAAAFTTTDQVEYAFNDERNFEEIVAGKPIVATLRAANGLPGQAGYSRSEVAPMPFAAGTGTALDYSAKTNSKDDGEVTVALPFAFPFGGISEQFVSVSTNGWVGFGTSPAYDYWNDVQNTDYRGVASLVGELERGIMPYWDDLNLENTASAGTGTVTEVVPPDNSFVAFQWNTGQYNVGNPRRTFQLVLFPDGSFRFDYPGTNTPGGNEAFIGYSLGTGTGSLDALAVNTLSVPTNSVLYTPKPVTVGSQLAAGQATLTLPAGSSLISAEPGCGLSQAPTATTEGLVTCSAPALPVGSQTAWVVRFATPPDAPGETHPANFRFHGAYTSGSVSLIDADEVDTLNTDLEATKTKLLVVYISPPTPTAGDPALYEVEVNPETGGLDEPTITFSLPANTILNSIDNEGDPLPCGAISGGQITCKLASGLTINHLAVTLTPTAAAVGQKLVLGATVNALNAPAVGSSTASPVVAP
jgi:CARDB protein